MEMLLNFKDFATPSDGFEAGIHLFIANFYTK